MKVISLKMLFTAGFMVTLTISAMAQNRYRYSVDLNVVNDDQIMVTLTPPAIKQKEITFYMPKIIPGTYRYADYGKFVHNFVATDGKGKALPVKQLDLNSWKIEGADKLAKITYAIEDTWESPIEHDIYDMAGTNIEDRKNFVLNTPGVFGYFDGLKNIPFELTIKKPESFYGATPLVATTVNAQQDVFTVNNADHLYDSPMMYSVPDTTTINLGKSKVLIATYSPKNQITSKAVADLLKDMLKATEHYLGGKLPVEKYAFIFYFNGEQAPLKRTGALEHNYSSFYALPEMPLQQIGPLLVDIAAHEFFHIVSPLTISSKEVKQFDFNKPVLSKHLWLYEGSTEYASDHVQVVEGLITPEQFLAKLSEKIKNSKGSYNDNLPFTELSKESAGTHKEQYNNVYEKGALISASLDLYLLHLSNGAYGLRNLKHDLGVKYGADQYFEDDKLFDIITSLTFPEVREFFTRYVEGPESIPYDRFFGYAGVNYVTKKNASLGNIQLNPTDEGTLMIVSTAQMNAMGKRLGYQAGDEILSLNGEEITVANAQAAIDKFKSTVKEGDPVEVRVRRSVNSEPKEILLKANMVMAETFALEFHPSPTPQQILIRNAWLGSKGKAPAESKMPPAANPQDVATIDQLVKALYDVISGPAGTRNWDRFRSLFYQDAYMGAMVTAPNGQTTLKKFSPEEYIRNNSPLFEKFSFREKEIGRVENVYGNIAQVFTAYEFTLEAPTPMKQRGINSIGLINQNGRWWIASITWKDETKDNPIPAKYLTFSK